MMGRRLGLLVVALMWLSAAATASAHEFRPAILQLDVAADGRVAMTWSPPAMTERGPVDDRLAPRLPAHCHRLGPETFDCGAAGLAPAVAVDGLDRHPTDVLVAIAHADGRRVTGRLTPAHPSMSTGAGTGVETTVAALVDYLRLGGRHILEGIDHLLLLLGLLLLARTTRATVRAVTGFSIGHGLTLLAVAGAGLRLPAAPVEACIALSIVCVAVEVRRGSGLGHTRPGLVSGLVGLLHGLGFAGALLEVGLPAEHTVVALVGFNLGVEAGQLAVVLGLAALAVSLRRWVPRSRWRMPLATGLGCVGAAWTIARLSALGGGL